MSKWGTLWWMHNPSVHWKYEGKVRLSSSFYCLIWPSSKFSSSNYVSIIFQFRTVSARQQMNFNAVLPSVWVWIMRRVWSNTFRTQTQFQLSIIFKEVHELCFAFPFASPSKTTYYELWLSFIYTSTAR